MDANVFIHMLVKSPKGDYAVSKNILGGIEEGEEAVTSAIQKVVNRLE